MKGHLIVRPNTGILHCFTKYREITLYDQIHGDYRDIHCKTQYRDKTLHIMTKYRDITLYDQLQGHYIVQPDTGALHCMTNIQRLNII